MATNRIITMPERGSVIVDWPGLAGGENGDMADIAMYKERSVQVVGTFGTSTVTIQGSNDGTNWFTLTDTLGVSLGALLAALLKGIRENSRFIRPIVAAGTGSGLRVLITGVK